MSNHETLIIDRRAERRFFVKEGAFAVCETRIGEVVDVSLGGLAFRYLGAEEWPEASFTADIILGQENSCLEDVPLLLVSDHKIAEPSSGSRLKMRRRGMQFLGLTPSQLFQLEYFIWVNSVL